MTFEESQADAAKKYLVALLEEYEGNIARAAIAAGRSRSNLYQLLDRYGVRRSNATVSAHRGNWAEHGL